MAFHGPQHEDVVVAMIPVTSRHLPVSPIQSLFLNRLSRLLRLKEEWRERRLPADWRTRLIDKAIYSTYCDCVEVGAAETARELIDRVRRPTG